LIFNRLLAVSVRANRQRANEHLDLNHLVGDRLFHFFNDSFESRVLKSGSKYSRCGGGSPWRTLRVFSSLEPIGPGKLLGVFARHGIPAAGVQEEVLVFC